MGGVLWSSPEQECCFHPARAPILPCKHIHTQSSILTWNPTLTWRPSSPKPHSYPETYPHHRPMSYLDFHPPFSHGVLSLSGVPLLTWILTYRLSLTQVPVLTRCLNLTTSYLELHPPSLPGHPPLLWGQDYISNFYVTEDPRDCRK